MTTPEAGASPFFIADHRACDDTWAALEAAASAGDAATSQARWETFHTALQRHFRMEEEVLFPALEEATGMRDAGPVAVMKHEHQQMRALLTELSRAAQAGDYQGLLDQGDTLLMVIQQHNAKEEGILYPLADRTLEPQWPALAERLKQY